MSIQAEHLQEQLTFAKAENEALHQENGNLTSENYKLIREMLNLYRQHDHKRLPDDRCEEEDGSYADLEHQVHTLVWDKLKLEDTVEALKIRLARFTEPCA